MITAGDFSSLVALRAKQGEFTALCEWDRAEQIQLVQPLLVLEPASSPGNQLDKVEEVARKLHERGRHLMIDASDVAHLPSFGGGAAGAFGELADRLDGPADLFDDYPVPFEPVIRSDASTNEISACRNLCDELGLGCAIRIRPAEDTGESLNELLEQLRLANADLDLILDLQYVPEITPQLAERAVDALRRIAKAGPFRSMTLLSGSVPRTLDRTSTWEQPRAEEVLWRLLDEETSVDLRLGDYGVVHPRPGGGFRSKHVNLKYSCSGRWMYSREPLEEAVDEVAAESARLHAPGDLPRTRALRPLRRTGVLLGRRRDLRRLRRPGFGVGRGKPSGGSGDFPPLRLPRRSDRVMNVQPAPSPTGISNHATLRIKLEADFHPEAAHMISVSGRTITAER